MNMVITLAIIAGAIYLQIFLSQKESKWLGLILPFIAFACSFMMLFSIAIVEGMTGGEIFGLLASVFVMANIPTIVLMALYFGCREKKGRKKALEKMNIQDLE